MSICDPGAALNGLAAAGDELTMWAKPANAVTIATRGINLIFIERTKQPLPLAVIYPEQTYTNVKRLQIRRILPQGVFQHSASYYAPQWWYSLIDSRENRLLGPRLLVPCHLYAVRSGPNWKDSIMRSTFGPGVGLLGQVI